MKKHTEYLIELNACQEAINYAEQFQTLQEVWDNCEKGDWMLWLVDKQTKKSNDRKKLTLVVCQCIRLSLKFVPENEKRPLQAIETAEKWANNVKGISLKDVKNAAAAAYDAAVAYGDDVAYAAYAAYAITTKAADTAAAYAITTNANEQRAVLKQYADIIRKNYPKIEIL